MSSEVKISENHVNDDDFVIFSHIAHYRVAPMFAELRSGSLYYNNSTNLYVNHNDEAFVFVPYIKNYSCHHGGRSRCLFPGLRLMDSSRGDEEITVAVCKFHVVCKNGKTVTIHLHGEKKLSASHDLYSSEESKIDCSIINHEDDDDEEEDKEGYCLPMSAIQLSKKGFLIDYGLIITIKYELMIHRTEFDRDGKYKIPPISHIVPSLFTATKFDHQEFKELTNGKKQSDNEDRFVLESSDGTRFCAHRNRLIVASDYFKGMFRQIPQEYNESKDQQLKMDDLSTEGLRQVLQFMYLGTVDKEQFSPVINEVATAADKYLMNNLKTFCHSHLVKLTDSPEVTIDQIIEFLRLAHKVNFKELKIVCMKWLRDRWHTVAGDDEVKELMNDEEGKEILWDLMKFSF